MTECPLFTQLLKSLKLSELKLNCKWKCHIQLGDSCERHREDLIDWLAPICSRSRFDQADKRCELVDSDPTAADSDAGEQAVEGEATAMAQSISIGFVRRCQTV